MIRFKNCKLCLFILACLIYNNQATAQFSKDYKVVKMIDLHKGKDVFGELISEDDTQLIILSTDGIEMKIPKYNIKKIRNVLYKPKRSFSWDQKKLGFEILTAVFPNNNGNTGIGVAFNVVKNLNSKYKLGFEAGYDVINLNEEFEFFNANLQFATAKVKLKGFLRKSMWSPYYATSLGYGFGGGSNGFSILSNSGGLAFDIFFGITKFNRNNSNKGFSLFTGYKFQKTSAFIRDFSDRANEFVINLNRTVVGISYHF